MEHRDLPTKRRCTKDDGGDASGKLEAAVLIPSIRLVVSAAAAAVVGTFYPTLFDGLSLWHSMEDSS